MSVTAGRGVDAACGPHAGELASWAFGEACRRHEKQEEEEGEFSPTNSGCHKLSSGFGERDNKLQTDQHNPFHPIHRSSLQRRRISRYVGRSLHHHTATGSGGKAVVGLPNKKMELKSGSWELHISLNRNCRMDDGTAVLHYHSNPSCKEEEH